MKLSIARSTHARLAVVLLTFLVYGWLLVLNERFTFSTQAISLSFPSMEILLGFSILVGLIYLSIGSLLFLYIRSRLVGTTLFCFSCSMALAFSLETSASLNIALPTLLATIGSVMALYLFNVLLLLFPHNCFVRPRERTIRRGHLSSLFASAYFILLTGILLSTWAAQAPVLVFFLRHWADPAPLTHLPPAASALPAFLLGIGNFVTLFISLRWSASRRERQQVRLIMGGIILAYTPFIVFTLVPTVIMHPQGYSPNSQFTTLAFGLVPIALGYAALRYHLLVLERHIRTAVSILVGLFCLAVGTYLVLFLFGRVLPLLGQPFPLWSEAAVMLLLVPLLWRFAPLVTERVFAPDLSFAHRLLYEEEQDGTHLLSASSSLERVVHMIMASARTVLQTRQLCFLVFDQERNSFQPFLLPAVSTSDGSDDSRDLLAHLRVAMNDTAPHERVDARLAVFSRLTHAPRPLFLSEVCAEGSLTRMGRLPLLTNTFAEHDPLLVPLYGRHGLSEPHLLGVLVLGAREEQIQYAGPDFALIDLLLLRFTSWYEMALLDAQTRQHVSMLKMLYSGVSTLADAADSPLEMLARNSAEATARATNAGVEVWLVEPQTGLLRRAAQVGNGPLFPGEADWHPYTTRDWTPWFSEGNSSSALGQPRAAHPPVVAAPDFPFAWLPLQYEGGKPLGVLVLTYASASRHFFPAERHILELLSHQLATMLENVQMTQHLRRAAVAQREDDAHRKQAIQSHLQGWLDLLAVIEHTLEALRRHDLVLPPSERATLSLALHEAFTLSAPESLQAFSSFSAALRELLEMVIWQTGERAKTPFPLSVQVNEILRDLEEEKSSILIMAPRAAYVTLLADALQLRGFLPVCTQTCLEALRWMQGVPADALPSVLLLDPFALVGMRLGDFIQHLRTIWRDEVRAAPIFLLRERDDGAGEEPAEYNWPVAYQEVPFTLSLLLTRLDASVRRNTG